MTRTAQMLLRGYGDRVGRTRMRADTSIREGFPPRGLLLVTGEDLPEAGQSTTARYLTVELERGAVDLRALTECQEKSHRLPSVLRAYLEWLAPQMDDLPATLADQFSRCRQKVRVESGHGRLPEAVAWLYIGFARFVTHALAAAALPPSAAAGMLGDAWQVFIGLGAEQDRRIAEDRPVERFLSVLGEVLASGTGYLADLEAAVVPRTEPGFLGWQDDQWYYLLPETTYKAVSQFINGQGGLFPVTARTLWQHLDAAGLIATEKNGEQIHRTVRERIGNKRFRVLKLSVAALRL